MVRLLVDPQTSGGLLAAVPADALDVYLEKIAAAGFDPAVIGVVTLQGEMTICASAPEKAASS